MNILNSRKKLLTLALAAVCSSAVNAKTESFSVGFTTLPDISITSITAMDFGQALKLQNGDTCTMNVDASNNFGNGAIEKSGPTGTAPSGTPGNLTGTCSGAADGTPGVYEVSGLSGSTVTIDLVGDTDTTDIDFLPVGYTYDFNADAYVAIDTTGPDTYDLAAGADGSATVTPGISRLILGGTITNQRALTAEEALVTSFTVNVNY